MGKIVKFLFGWTMPLILWFADAFQGHDGKASSRKLSSFAFMCLIGTSSGKMLMRETSINDVYILCVLVATFLLLTGILTIQNVIAIWKNK